MGTISSALDVYNGALQAIGLNVVLSSLTDGSREQVICTQHYQRARHSMIMGASWPFSTQRVSSDELLVDGDPAWFTDIGWPAWCPMAPGALGLYTVVPWGSTDRQAQPDNRIRWELSTLGRYRGGTSGGVLTFDSTSAPTEAHTVRVVMNVDSPGSSWTVQLYVDGANKGQKVWSSDSATVVAELPGVKMRPITVGYSGSHAAGDEWWFRVFASRTPPSLTPVAAPIVLLGSTQLLELLFAFDVTDVSLWPEYMIDALVANLGMRIAMPLTSKPDLAKWARDQFREAMSEALGRASEQTDDGAQQYQSDMLLSRG
jgi:hypothetical protein